MASTASGTDRNRWPYLDRIDYVLGATVWAYEGERVNVIPADNPDLFGVHRHRYAALAGYGPRLPGRGWGEPHGRD